MSEDIFSVFDSEQDEPATLPCSSSAAPDNDVDINKFVASIVSGSSSSGKKHKSTPDAGTDGEQKKPKLDAEHGDEEYDADSGLLGAAPQIKVVTMETAESCTHEVALPAGQDLVPLRQLSREPAKKYPFQLDPFQQEAILCIENCQSVMVSAHTSAGKTVTAEYAIALSLKEKQRVIYTTPIKALSNQKYREFKQEFSDVGLITGDVTINPSASCLIMTTEILRSMLYHGSEIMREVAWVIFDEIHYMRDKERGVVWEESIILLPNNVHYVFLSATIPNARQFAEWIAHLHNQPCHVIYTDYRPTPLQHYIFPSGGDGIHLVVDEHGIFREDNFSQAMAVLANSSGQSRPFKDRRRLFASGGGGGGAKQGSESDCYKIIKMIMERNFAPVIVFSFSKKECEAYAMQMSKLDFNSAEEKKLVEEVFHSAMMVLSESDRALPQVENVLPLLKRGIGIHHGGLLPILKETTEILFGEGLIKTLFATETFSMGLNMPARTVLFTSARKFDGTDARWITSGEYIQMSGRAGRRGIDDKGIVMLMVDEKMAPSVGRNLVRGSADPICSAFRLTYNMVLNLLRVEGIDPEYMMERSFYQFQSYSSIPKLCQDVLDLEGAVASMSIRDENMVEAYYRLRQQLSHLSQEFRSWLVRPQYLVPFLQCGRLVRIQFQDKDFGYGVVVNFRKQVVKEKDNPMEPTQYQIDACVLVTEESSKAAKLQDLMPGNFKEALRGGVMKVVTIHPDLIQQISSVRILVPNDIRSPDSCKAVLKSIQQVHKRFGDALPLLDPIDDMKILDKSFKEVVGKISTFESRLKDLPLHSRADRQALLTAYEAKDTKMKQLSAAKAKLKQAKSLLQMTHLKQMKRVLRRLDYCTPGDVIQLKGRIACELSSADELLLTEMIFNGVFSSMSASQSAAILSCFVCDEKANEVPKLANELTGPLRLMQDMAKRIAQVSKDAKIEIEVEDYVSKFKPFMMDVVHEWCKGASFADICKMTDLFEGSIIRCMRRLEELLRQMVQASRSIGNTDLEIKFLDAIKLLRRDIVFAGSLYL